ncbi:hypothetical protein [Collimonas sp. OK412]|jgi:hypothetical protein|uniref:hypothetical protein n=1 Tax=Collimonas sp. (strain OK412) TaxID=1801619 RepID=UPI0008E8BBC0|nr:hypothetical protein [Collimonas sp. OK412]SFB69346.1 hypothetical protein SAMN04515619_10132 [Collimonas sp. OK412]
MPKQHAEYNNAKTEKVSTFYTKLKETAVSSTGVFDSASAGAFIADAQSLSASITGVEVPENLQILFDESGDGRAGIAGAILDGAAFYEAEHGVEPTADVLEWAIHQAYATSESARSKYKLDSASNLAHDPMSLQQNRAVISITAAMAEAIPVANYLPADIGSNEAPLVIVSHEAGSTFGHYGAGDLMDGVLSGRAYTSAQRTHLLKRTGDDFGGKVTPIQLTADTCDQDAPSAKLLKGRTIIYINGLPVAKETSADAPASASPISGYVRLGGTLFTVSGSMNSDTGAVKVTTVPALPANTPVIAEAVIDFENNKGIIPIVNTIATRFLLRASPWKANAFVSTDSQTQMANEIGLNPMGESMLAIRNQFANERHYQVLEKAARIGANNAMVWDFKWDTQGLEKTRAQIWQDGSCILGAASQQMAEDTMDHGITHLYVSKKMAAMIQGLPSTLFVPSGVTARPGIYRVGRLFGMYEVYYSPRIVDVDQKTTRIICIGRSTQVARNPFVLGDAVAPMLINMNADEDQRYKQGFYARNFTAVNPHLPSAMGCAVIEVINLD